jgi:FMN phosphatase YigB (HAD superfamily)/DNA-binding XRE family transcriptional regulator
MAMEQGGAEKALGKKLQEIRQAAGLTQQELCAKTGLSYSTLAKIERGAIRSPSIFTVRSIAEACGASLDAILGSATISPAPTVRSSKTGVRFVYFDVNGVLVRFFQRAFVAIAKDTGVSNDLIESTFWHYNDAVCRGEISLEQFNESLAQRLSLPSVDWQKYYLDAVDPIQEMHECVRQTIQRYQVGLMTNIMPGIIDQLLQRGLLPDVPYTAVIDSSEIGAIKPEAAIYEAAQGLAGVEGNEILLIDDSRANLMAAERMGWHVMWFDDYRPDEGAERVRLALE